MVQEWNKLLSWYEKKESYLKDLGYDALNVGVICEVKRKKGHSLKRHYSQLQKVVQQVAQSVKRRES